MARGNRERERERKALSKLDATPPWETRHHGEVPPTTGPFDEKDAPTDDQPYIDLGALRVPVRPDADVRLELNEAKQIVAVTVVTPEGTMQLGLFAAPRNEGIWDEVRAEIAASMNQQKGQPKERTDGPFGTELLGLLPTDDGQRMPVRFIGIDGPRWFVRAMLVGPHAAEPERAQAVEELLRSVVVVRGNDPLPVREPVPLQLPKDVVLPDLPDEA